MSLEQAIYDTAHEFPGGVKALADRINTTPGRLYNKTSPELPDHRLNIFEARAMMLVSADLRILQALAFDLGQGCFTLGDFSDCSDLELIERITALGAARGEVDAAIHEALSDGMITPCELEKIERRIQGVIRANLELLTRLRGLVVAAEERSKKLKVAK